ncbi:phosphatase PAP2 family protein [Aspergillus brunneoviolaceus CBS 621.78]|uniref:Acid phosphatase/Vanadium-dependent haloperoxidase n=1 Tax=Aspergillus brunneoviolaceus CBS 621.78 TaxID=1450534 RepID=A0ACD1FT88_9EURO|nr:acid phosphatase/Vanadium-dependent haloperoxidase [Aspergillus brunneoviolaceus CBS 621.78]RAH40193.1 acid phosphatase/Vanadium-dependent haloperoxidase [Aspergillus brunneoviolaceus CBS 621.78]
MARNSNQNEQQPSSAATTGANELGAAHVRFSKRLVVSYILDWILIIGIALIGYGFGRVSPNQRPFSLTDPSISFPHRDHDTVSVSVVAVVALIVPAVIIVLGALLWEWNAGWLGLGISLAGAYMATEGLKDLFGKPRPDMLARCDPDLSKIGNFAVSGLGSRLDGAPTLVTWEICRNQARELAVDGFSSFPSGHSSFAFGGLTYLTLWLCAKLSIGFPYLAHSPLSQDLQRQERSTIRRQGAAPPVYLLIIVFVPIAVAFFIAASRWFDYRHHGFDIIFGSVMGIVFAWIGFRLYQLPVMRGAGWSWGARDSSHAFFRSVGLPSHVCADNWATAKYAPPVRAETRDQDIDLESGRKAARE